MRVKGFYIRAVTVNSDNQRVRSMNYDAIYNYYERLVYDAISRAIENSEHEYTQDEIEDIACLALNALPSRYVRYTVDTVYFQSDQERINMDKNVQEAVDNALSKVLSNPHSGDTSGLRSA